MKQLEKHKTDYIHIPKSWAKYLFLFACWATTIFLTWQILLLAAQHKAELDEITVLNLIYCLGFATPIYLLLGGNIYISIRMDKELLLMLPLLPLLPLLLLLMLPLMLLPLLPLMLLLMLPLMLLLMLLMLPLLLLRDD